MNEWLTVVFGVIYVFLAWLSLKTPVWPWRDPPPRARKIITLGVLGGFVVVVLIIWLFFSG